MTPATAILIPVLNRPEKVAPLIENIEAVTPEPHRIIFLPSAGDDIECDALRECPLVYNGAVIMVDEPGTWARKINAGFRVTSEPFVFLAADDLKYRRHWLDMALEIADETGAGVIGTNDCCNDRSMRGIHSTHSLVRRSYIEEVGGTVDQGPGVVLFPGYAHDFADDELVEVAKSRGAYAHAMLSGVEHHHPLCGKAPMDSTYELGMRVGPGPGKKLFRARRPLWDASDTGRMARIGAGHPSRKARRRG